MAGKGNLQRTGPAEHRAASVLLLRRHVPRLQATRVLRSFGCLRLSCAAAAAACARRWSLELTRLVVLPMKPPSARTTTERREGAATWWRGREARRGARRELQGALQWRSQPRCSSARLPHCEPWPLRPRSRRRWGGRGTACAAAGALPRPPPLPPLSARLPRSRKPLGCHRAIHGGPRGCGDAVPLGGRRIQPPTPRGPGQRSPSAHSISC
jgi:hypothetical protein